MTTDPHVPEIYAVLALSIGLAVGATLGAVIAWAGKPAWFVLAMFWGLVVFCGARVAGARVMRPGRSRRRG